MEIASDLKNYIHTQAEVEAFDTVVQDCRQRVAQLLEVDALYRQTAQFAPEQGEAAEYAETLRQTITAYREMEQRAIENQRQLVQTKERVESFLLGIPDANLRRAFSVRYLKGMTWHEVASALGGYATDLNVRQQAHRYMKKVG